MHWLHCINIAVLLVLLPFALPTTALVFPRRDFDTQLVSQNSTKPIAVPLFRHSKIENFPAKRDVPEQPIASYAPDAPLPAHEHMNTFMSIAYYINATVGTQQLRLFVDTGSSDTWVVGRKFSCFEYTWEGFQELNQEDCWFGDYFNEDESPYLITVDTRNDSFKVAYADYSSVSGHVVRDFIRISDLEVFQAFGVAEAAYWKGDNFTSGILGLGHPGTLTSEPGHKPYEYIPSVVEEGSFPDSTPTYKKYDCHPVYNSFVENLSQGGYENLFSIAINRTEYFHKPGIAKSEQDEAGVIYLGGVPDLPDIGLPFAKASLVQKAEFLESVSEAENCTSNPRRIGYRIEIDGFYWGNGSVTHQKEIAIVDSGASYNLLPDRVFMDLMNSYQPHHCFMRGGGTARAPCDTTPPEFGIIIGGVVFMIDQKDLLQHIVYQGLPNEDENFCSCGFGLKAYAGPASEMVLGDPFLRNVLAVYDIGNNEMRFAKRFY